MTDDAKTIVNAYAYDPFGKVTNSVENISNPFKFLGQYGVAQDSSGLTYMRARYYASELGRFLTTDPLKGKIDDLQTLNRYIYALNNPVRFSDASGLITKEDAIEYVKKEFAGEVQTLIENLLKDATMSLTNKFGFSPIGDVSYVTNRVLKYLPLIEIGEAAGDELGKNWDNPNMDWTEKAARVSLRIAVRSTESLVGEIPYVGNLLEPVVEMYVDRNFENWVDTLKEAGNGISGWITPDNTPVILDQDAIRRQRQRNSQLGNLGNTNSMGSTVKNKKK
jgi:RHS repeat-associated protein